MIPRLETVEQAANAVSWMRFPPDGMRGLALSTRGAGQSSVAHADVQKLNALPVGIFQVESPAAVTNADAHGRPRRRRRPVRRSHGPVAQPGRARPVPAPDVHGRPRHGRGGLPSARQGGGHPPQGRGGRARPPRPRLHLHRARLRRWLDLERGARRAGDGSQLHAADVGLRGGTCELPTAARVSVTRRHRRDDPAGARGMAQVAKPRASGSRTRSTPIRSSCSRGRGRCC